MKLKAYVKDNKDKLIFGCVVAISYLMILVYNCLTPHMADDYFYLFEVLQADSFFDLISQEYHQYMTINGRSVNHLLLRSFLSLDKSVFNVMNALAFMVLSFFIYKLSNKKKNYNISLFILIQIILWQCSVQFGQTILWEAGACNYLWPSMFIQGFAYKFFDLMENDTKGKYSVWSCVGFFLYGIIAGWGNENTSGGLILLIVMWTGFYFYKNKKINNWMIAAVTGLVTGFGFMLLAPGYRVRSGYFAEEYTGIVLLFSRFYKITIEIKNWFLPLIVIYAILVIIILTQKNSIEKILKSISFFISFLAICYALVLSPTPQSRVYFGAGIFLFIAILQIWEEIVWDDIFFCIIKYSVVASCTIIFLFTYFEEGFNVARIYRESIERDEYVLEQKALGKEYVIVPMLRPQFETKYSSGYSMDYQEEDTYWINQGYAQYRGLKAVSALPREEWEQILEE